MLKLERDNLIKEFKSRIKHIIIKIEHEKKNNLDVLQNATKHYFHSDEMPRSNKVLFFRYLMKAEKIIE